MTVRRIGAPAERPLRYMPKAERRKVIEKFAPLLGIQLGSERRICAAEKELADLTPTGLERRMIDQGHREAQEWRQTVAFRAEYDPFEREWEK